MKNIFASKVKELRKGHRLTQEQLADVMNVTVGAVYKWEQGLSVPDISVIMDIADYFKISVDNLVGFELVNDDKDKILTAFDQIKIEKSYFTAHMVIEDSIKRFPNDFDIAYQGGILYGMFGSENNDCVYLKRSIDLLARAGELINQNHNPEITLTSINREIGISYIQVGEIKKGLELLKADNPCGVNDSLLGFNYAFDISQKDLAQHYLTKALFDESSDLFDVICGFSQIFLQDKKFAEALRILNWALTFLDGLRMEPKPSFLDKDYVFLLSLCAYAEVKLNHDEAAKNYLLRAYQIALNFDANPDYTTQNIRYCQSLIQVVSYDDGGKTAVATIENILTRYKKDEYHLYEIWEEIKK